MAAAVVSTLRAFGDLIVHEANFLGGFPDGVEWLNDELQWIQSFLKDDANSRRRKADERTKTLTRQIRDVAYEIDDLTDIIRSMSHESRYQSRCFPCPILRYALHPFECLSVHCVLVGIQRIEKKIHDISERIKSYGNINLAQSSSNSSGNVEENIGVYRHYEAADEDVVGFDKDKKELVRRLLNQRRRSVISIVGMGGIGKTTLARKLFNDSQVKRHFPVLSWVTVSQSYRAADILKTIAKKIIMGIEMEQLRNMKYEEVREELAKHLSGKRYLIVLDDVWETRAWAQMKDAFPDYSQNGSRVLLTSRNIDVARSVDPLSDPYELPLLDEEDSWKLLRKKAFPSPKGIEPSCPKQLEDIGRKLAKKCGGLALALVMLGALLFKKGPSVAAWMELVESIDWEATGEHGTTCFDILALSYDDLPSENLRSCFLYLASFPEDSIISATKLIRLWIAEGFVQQKRNRILEQTARTYLDELVQRCMVQVAEISLAHGWVNRVRIHDVLREWCIAEARKEEFLYVFNKLENNDSPSVDGMPFRRVALLDKMDDQLHVHFPKLRTLMAFGGSVVNPTSITMYFSHLRFLRVLDLQGTKNLKEIPKDIKKMIHLRYLGLRDTDFKIIPSSIGELQYLQTLDARRSKIEQLPITFWKIPTLRNVHTFLPMRTSIIPNFKTLHVVKWIEAGEWIETCNATNFHKLAIVEILEVHRSSLSRFLKNQYKLLSLSVIISDQNGTRIVTDIMESFSNHHQLRSLCLRSGIFKTVIEHLPRICEFLPTLTKLKLWCLWFMEDPMEQLERLPNLLHLHIRALSNEVGRRLGDSWVKSFKTMTCTAGGFPNLQSFEFGGSDVEEWKVEIFAMPKLTYLNISCMTKLRNIPDGLLHITSLNELMFYLMSSEFVDRFRESDGVSWNIIRDEDEGKHITIVPIRPIDSTNNVLPGN